MPALTTNSWADKQFEANQRTHRVARQAEYHGLAESTEKDRFARLHGDFVEVWFDAQLLQNAGHQVELSGRDAAGQDQHGETQTFGNQSPEVLGVVARNA